MDGSLVLNMAGPVCAGGKPPGVVTYFDNKGNKSGSKVLPIVNSKHAEAEA